MPVRNRKNISFTPSSLDRMSDEEDADYLQDPDQLHDSLPQPYRMINKVINILFQDVWEIIEEKENKRLAEERRIRPPKYESPNRLPVLSQVTALASSTDGKYLFAGLPNGITAVDALNQQTLSLWEESGSEITSIKTFSIIPGAFLLVTLDDMAVARLFLFSCDCLFPVKVLNESDGGGKVLVNHCEASLEGDYLGVVFENTSSKEVWFEAHKLPRETWTSELEIIEAKMQKQRERGQKHMEERPEQISAIDSADQQLDESPKSQEKLSVTQMSSPILSNIIVESSVHRFSTPTLVLRVKPPASYAANTCSSAFSACQKVDATGTVLGTGQTHIMSATHLEQRDTIFQLKHSGEVKYMTKSEKKKDQEMLTATFHFLNPGRTLLTGLEPAGQTDRPTCMALWWEGSSHLLQFSLLKVAKDVEHKADVVWPFSSKITCSAISVCSSFIAIGLANGCVIIWDRFLGLQQGVVNMNQESCVKVLRFLDPSLYPPSTVDYPPYPQQPSPILLVQYSDSTQYLHDVSQNTQDQPICISGLPESDDEVEILLESVPDIPELYLVVQKNGLLYLKDIQAGVKVCQLALPKTHQLMTPWQPVAAFGHGGQLLYVKGIGEETNESEETTDISGVFVFTLRSYPTLDHYWNKSHTPVQPYVYPTIEKRLDALMKERMEFSEQNPTQLFDSILEESDYTLETSVQPQPSCSKSFATVESSVKWVTIEIVRATCVQLQQDNALSSSSRQSFASISDDETKLQILLDRLGFLNNCLETKGRFPSAACEKSWGNFHREYARNVANVSTITNYNSCSYWLCLRTFEKLVALNYASEETNQPTREVSVTQAEEDILQYIGGYIVHKLMCKFGQAVEAKSEILSCFVDEAEPDHLDPGKKSLTTLFDRGGLTHVKPVVVSLLTVMEKEFRTFSSGNTHFCSQKEFVSVCLEDAKLTDIFYQITYKSSATETDKEQILRVILQLFFKIRIHHKCKTFMDQNRFEKNSSKKAKGLRKTLKSTVTP